MTIKEKALQAAELKRQEREQRNKEYAEKEDYAKRTSLVHCLAEQFNMVVPYDSQYPIVFEDVEFTWSRGNAIASRECEKCGGVISVSAHSWDSLATLYDEHKCPTPPRIVAVEEKVLTWQDKLCDAITEAITEAIDSYHMYDKP